jgi:hypothetical protein
MDTNPLVPRGGVRFTVNLVLPLLIRTLVAAQVSAGTPTQAGAPPLPSPPPPPPDCPSPRLGSLCGQNAIGAIVGICVGGVVMLALLAATVYYLAVRVGDC